MARTPLFRLFVLALQAARRENHKELGLPLPEPRQSNGWSRRKFIKATGAVSVAGLAGGLLATPDTAKAAQNTPTIAIVGAGMAGLNAAYQLQKMGITATVYEARIRTGGRMRSVDMGDGLIIDLGAELINSDHTDMLDLVSEFDIELFSRADDIANSPFPSEIFLFEGVRYDITQVADDIRELAAQIGEDAALLDLDWDTYAPQFDKISVAKYLEIHAEKISKPYINELIKFMIRTEYGVEPYESSALQLLFILPIVDGQAVELLSYSDEMYSVVGGSAEITNALTNALKAQIQLGKRLTKIRKQGKQFQLEFSHDAVVQADIVILAMPFPVLDQIDLQVPLPKLLRRFIKEAKLGNNEKAIAGFSQRFWRQPQGFTDGAWSDFGFSEVWDATQRQSDRQDGALNFFLGGEQARKFVEQKEPSRTTKEFIKGLDRFISDAVASGNGRFISSAWAKSPYTIGGYANYKPGQLTQFGDLFWIESDNPDEDQQVAVGNLIFAGEHLSDAFYGFMNGAAETGRLAAKLAKEKITALA